MKRLKINSCNPCCGGNTTTSYTIQEKKSFVVVRDICERNNIPCQMRQDGMIVIVVDENYSRYTLKSNYTNKSICDNSSWIKLDNNPSTPTPPIIDIPDLDMGTSYDLQRVTDVGNVTTNSIKVQDVIIQNNPRGATFYTKDEKLTKNDKIQNSYIIGENIIPNFGSQGSVSGLFEDNLIVGKNILTKTTGKGEYRGLYDRNLANDCNIMLGLDLANTTNFNTSENNIIIGKDVFYDRFGDEDINNYHAFTNIVTGYNIQSRLNKYNNNVDVPYVSKALGLNSIYGHNIESNVFHKATIFGGNIVGVEFDNSIFVGTTNILNHSTFHYTFKPEHIFRNNIVISNRFDLEANKKPQNAVDYLYIGNDTPLIEGNLNKANRRLKFYGRVQLEGSLSDNNVQGDFTYNKLVVARPDGTLGLIPKEGSEGRSSLGKKSLVLTDSELMDAKKTNPYRNRLFELSKPHYEFSIPVEQHITIKNVSFHFEELRDGQHITILPTSYIRVGNVFKFHFSDESMQLMDVLRYNPRSTQNTITINNARIEYETN